MTIDPKTYALAAQIPGRLGVFAAINMICAALLVESVGMTWLVDLTVPENVGKSHLAVRVEDVLVTARLRCVRQRRVRSGRGAIIRVHGGGKTRQRRDGQCKESAMHVGLQFGYQDTQINPERVPGPQERERALGT